MLIALLLLCTTILQAQTPDSVMRDRRQRAAQTLARSPLAQHAIDAWSSREHVPFWQIYTTNLRAGWPPTSIPAGTTINFEPIAAVDGQAFFLEDMYLITPVGAELLTPGVPYSADDIECAMVPATVTIHKVSTE